MIAKKIATVVIATGLLGACANNDMGNKQGVGAILGGVGGAVAGAQFGKGTGQIAATALGTLAGAYLGSEVGRSLDRADQQAMGRAEQQAHAAPIGQSIRWDNPESGHYGTVTPTREGTDTATGAYCREYQTTIDVGGRKEQAFGTACRQPDGSWKVVK